MDESSKFFQSFMHERRFSKLESDLPCKSCFPKFFEAKKFEIVLEEGSCLFIPRSWFHMVFSEKANERSGLNIAINTWFNLNEASEKTEDDILDEKNNIDDVPMFDDCTSGHLIHQSKVNQPFVSKHPFMQDSFMNMDLLKRLVVDTSKKVNINTSSTNCFDSNYLINKKSRTEQQSIEYFLSKAREQQQNGEKFFYISSHSSLNTNTEEYILNCVRETSFMNPIDLYTWINFGNVHTILHYDGRDNFLCQVHGSKRIILIPPFEYDKLYLYNPYPYKFLKTLKDPYTSDNKLVCKYKLLSVEYFNILSRIFTEDPFTHFEFSYKEYEMLYSYIFQCISSIVDCVPNIAITPLSCLKKVTCSQDLENALHQNTCMQIHHNIVNDISFVSAFIVIINTNADFPVQFTYGSTKVNLEPFVLYIIKKSVTCSLSLSAQNDLKIVILDVGIQMTTLSY